MADAASARRRRVPFVAQLAETDCGAACLGMVLAYHGKSVPLDVLRDETGVSRDGTDALAVLEGARSFGLDGRAVRITEEHVPLLPAGAILHWARNHFVVFERMRGDQIDLVDPAFGPRRMPRTQFMSSFSGVALLLEPTAAFVPEAAAPRPLWAYLRQMFGRSSELPRIFVLSVLLQIFALALPLLTGEIVGRVIPANDRSLLGILGAGLGMVVFFHFVSSLTRAQLLLHLRTRIDQKMTLSFLEHMGALPYSFFLSRSAGDLMMRLNSNATIREILTTGTVSGLLDGALVSIYLVFMIVMSPRLGLLVVFVAVLQIGLYALSRHRVRALMSRNLEAQSRAESFEVQLFAGMETLKAMGSEERAIEHWARLFEDTLNASLNRGKLGALVDSLSSALHLGAPLLVLGYGAALTLHGDLPLATMLALAALSTGFLTPFASVLGTLGQLQLLDSYVERIDDVLRVAPEQDRAQVRPAADLVGRIELDRVDFRYARGGALVLRQVSLQVEPGELIAIVGPSGSGKTTLANLLLGLHLPSAGVVRYDGVDLRELDLRSLRQQVGVVTQRPYLFGRSIRENIALADPTLPDERIAEAAALAQIRDEIEALPLRYDTPLTNGAATLSGGQRQRIALARALVRRPRVLLLDEATSALDTVTERKVKDAISVLKCTRIVIAHRMSTVMEADRIVVVVAGEVVQVGHHDELVAVAGAYRDLFGREPRRSDERS